FASSVSSFKSKSTRKAFAANRATSRFFGRSEASRPSSSERPERPKPIARAGKSKIEVFARPRGAPTSRARIGAHEIETVAGGEHLDGHERSVDDPVAWAQGGKACPRHTGARARIPGR